MPPLIAAVVLGAGVYVGFRAIRHVWMQMKSMPDPVEAMAPGQPDNDTVKDLGTLELDPKTGVYHPERRD